jgi:hypothetical protein
MFYPDKLPPFRIHLESEAELKLNDVDIINADTGERDYYLISFYKERSVDDIQMGADGSEGVIVSFDSYARRENGLALPPGDYYYQIEVGGKTYYSEVFRIVGHVGKADFLNQLVGQYKHYLTQGQEPEHIISFLESSYFSGNTFGHNIIIWTNSLPLGEMKYTDTYYEYLLLDYDAGESSYKNEEKGKKNANGDFIAESLGVSKSRQINGLFPEYLLDGLSTLWMHDVALLVTRQGRMEHITGSDIKASWLDDGCMAKTVLQLDTSKQIYSIGSIC